jgi:hypothetical protein
VFGLRSLRYTTKQDDPKLKADTSSPMPLLSLQPKAPALPDRSSYRRYRLFVSMPWNRDMRIAGCIVRAARRRVNKLRRKIWSRW